MTYGEVRREALRLAFQDSIAGERIPENYNNQADYTAMIPGLVDAAQMDIVTRAKKQIPAFVSLSDLSCSENGAFYVYNLPADCQDIMHGGLVYTRGNDIGRYSGYKLIGQMIFVPKSFSGELSLEYWRYPVSVGSDPADNIQLDNTEDTHSAIPYYVAAQMLLYDDPFRYQALRNEYETRISALHNPVFVENGKVEDVYDFFGGGFW